MRCRQLALAALVCFVPSVVSAQAKGPQTDPPKVEPRRDPPKPAPERAEPRKRDEPKPTPKSTGEPVLKRRKP